MEEKITYFKSPGRANTDAVMEIVGQRAPELGIGTAVVASYRGYTADKAVRALDAMRIVVVAGFAHPTTENLAETFAQGDEALIRCALPQPSVQSLDQARAWHQPRPEGGNIEFRP